VPRLTPQEIERRLLRPASLDRRGLPAPNGLEPRGHARRAPLLRPHCTPDTELVFEARASLPRADGARWLLRFDITGNALLKVDGEPYQGIDEQHRLAVVEHGGSQPSA
jgi:hypothetical protein